MSIFEIAVVEHRGEKLFKTGNLLFDQLKAERVFEGGKLTVVRNGQPFAETSEIQEYGTHAATTCFLGLSRVFPDNSIIGYAVSSLVPESFETGDLLVLDISQGGSLEGHLRSMAALYSSFLRTLDENPNGITIGELNRKLPGQATEAARQIKDAEVVRFR